MVTQMHVPLEKHEELQAINMQLEARIKVLEAELARANQRNSDLGWALEASQAEANELSRDSWK